MQPGANILPCTSRTKTCYFRSCGREGLVYKTPSLKAVRTRAQEQLAILHSGIKTCENPHQYPAGLELTLQEFKTELILRAKGEI